MVNLPGEVSPFASTPGTLYIIPEPSALWGMRLGLTSWLTGGGPSDANISVFSCLSLLPLLPRACTPNPCRLSPAMPSTPRSISLPRRT